MSGTNPDATDFRGWMRETRQRIAALEYRAPAHRALDLLGPGIDSSATLVSNWNDDTVYFNGYYYSEVGADNAPDGVNRWLGFVLIDDLGSGYQLLIASPDPSATDLSAWTHIRKHRVFSTPSESTRVYSAWATP